MRAKCVGRETRGCKSGGGGSGGGSGAHVACGAGPSEGWVFKWQVQRSTRAHQEHVVHVRDAGRVEAQWLVESRREVEHEAHARDAGRVTRLSGWLKAEAESNMPAMLETLTCQGSAAG